MHIIRLHVAVKDYSTDIVSLQLLLFAIVAFFVFLAFFVLRQIKTTNALHCNAHKRPMVYQYVSPVLSVPPNYVVLEVPVNFVKSALNDFVGGRLIHMSRDISRLCGKPDEIPTQCFALCTAKNCAKLTNNGSLAIRTMHSESWSSTHHFSTLAAWSVLSLSSSACCSNVHAYVRYNVHGSVDGKCKCPRKLCPREMGASTVIWRRCQRPCPRQCPH